MKLVKWKSTLILPSDFLQEILEDPRLIFDEEALEKRGLLPKKRRGYSVDFYYGLTILEVYYL